MFTNLFLSPLLLVCFPLLSDSPLLFDEKKYHYITRWVIYALGSIVLLCWFHDTSWECRRVLLFLLIPPFFSYLVSIGPATFAGPDLSFAWSFGVYVFVTTPRLFLVLSISHFVTRFVSSVKLQW